MKRFLRKGIKITLWSSGKMTDPRSVKRTDAISDIVKKDNEKLSEKIRKWFDGHHKLD